MASTLNAFALLHGAEQAVAQANKKSKKPKAAKVAAVVEVNASSTGTEPAGVQGADLIAAAAVRDAHEHKTASDKARLWREWIRQAGDKSAKAPKYLATNGSLLEFKQVLLQSKALEVSVEGCLVSGVPHDRGSGLAALLAAVLPSSAAPSAANLASALERLVALVADDAPDTLGAAQRAVHSVVAALKVLPEGKAADSEGGAAAAQGGLGRVLALDALANKHADVLSKLATASRNVVSREQTLLALQICRAHEEKLDLLASSSTGAALAAGASAGKEGGAAMEASLKALEDLKTVITHHVKTLEQAPKGGATAETSKRNLAAFRREETILDTQAAEVAAQIRVLDSQLQSLRTQAAAIEDKKAQIQQRQRCVALDDKNSGSARGNQSALSANHYQDELAVTEALQQIVDPRRSQRNQQQQAGPQAGVTEAAPVQYVESAHRYLTLTLSSLGDMPAKVAFCKLRSSQAQKLLALGAPGGAAQKEDAEKLLAETVRGAEELMNSGVQVVSEVQRRYAAITRMAAAAEHTFVSQQIATVEGMVGQLRSAYDAVIVATTAVAPVPEPKQGGGGGGGGGGGRGGGRNQKHQQAPYSAAPAPAAAPLAEAPASHPVAAPVVQATTAAVAPAAPAPEMAAPAAAAAPPPRAPVPVGRSWGKVQAAAPAAEGEGDLGMTPAEAARAAEAAGASSAPKVAAPGGGGGKKKNLRRDA